MTRRTYAGSVRIRKLYGATEKSSIVGLNLDKKTARLLRSRLDKYIRSNTTKPVDITVFRDRENDEGIHTTITYK